MLCTHANILARCGSLACMHLAMAMLDIQAFKLVSRLSFPNPNCLVSATRCKLCAVGAPGGRFYFIFMSFQHSYLFPNARLEQVNIVYGVSQLFCYKAAVIDFLQKRTIPALPRWRLWHQSSHKPGCAQQVTSCNCVRFCCGYPPRRHCNSMSQNPRP